jgi:cation/acetate symporter
MVGLAFAIAASANFPALLMSIMWKNFSTVGATLSIATGAILAVGLIIISPTVWVDVLGNAQAIFPWKNPALISLPAAFVTGWLGSVMVPDEDAEAKYANQRIRNYLGVGAE